MRRIEAAHMATGGMGTKGSDYSCLPLCRDCHGLQHSIGILTFLTKYDINVRALTAALRNEFERVN